MFIYFADRYVRMEHITTFTSVTDNGEGAGSSRYSCKISLINGEELTDVTGNERIALQTYSRLEEMING